MDEWGTENNKQSLTTNNFAEIRGKLNLRASHDVTFLSCLPRFGDDAHSHVSWHIPRPWYWNLERYLKLGGSEGN